MTSRSPVQKSTAETVKAVRRFSRSFSRRHFLRRGAAGLGVAATGPWYIKDALSSSGECRVFIWTGYFPQAFVDKFESSTGIKLRITEMASNEQLINKLKSTRGRGFDLVTPTLMRSDQWKDLDLLQAWEPELLPLDNLEPRFLAASERHWTWNYGLYHLPHLWGTEAMGYRTDLYETEYGKLSLGDLWQEDVKGKIMGRPHSMMSGIGRYLASIGEIQPFEDAYKDEETMRSIWSDITSFAIDHKEWLRLFWRDSNTQQAGLRRNGVALGQTWDGPIIAMKNAGEPVNYMAPKEGAFAWLDGFSLPTGADNIDQAYELVKACYQSDSAGLQASISGYNPTVKGASDFLSGQAKAAFHAAYPEDALEKLWWWLPEPQWYADVRAEYADKYVAA
ncbi:MAG: extracellular solute-binding protein [Rhodospirillales bacterium]|nr:extracellular solute-binding protein [Rhodospirillales bacterium]